MEKEINWLTLENWKEAFDELEKRNYDKIVAKYLEGRNVVEISGQKFYDDVHKNASVLCRAGLQGKHIGLIGNTSYDMVVNFCAMIYIGSVAVVLSKDYTKEELKEYGDFVELEGLIFEHSLEDLCLSANLGITLIDIGESTIPDVVSMRKEREKPLEYIVNNTKKEDLINISFTSGTTGKSKAIMHSNGTMIAGVFPTPYYEECNSMLVMFPFHHIAGFGLALEGLSEEKTICIGNGPQNVYRYLKLMKPDAVLLVPAVLQTICQKLKNHTQEELGWNLRLVICGGARCPVSVLEIAVKSGIILRQNYGSSETLGRGTTYRVSLENLDSIGKTDLWMETKLVNGELAMKGECVCLGYYKNPEETSSTFRDGWYYTGDIARVDADGMYYLTGRKKNLIILSNGENVSPEEIEQALTIHEEIREIMVREEKDFIGAVIYPNFAEEANEEEKSLVKRKIDSIIEQYNERVPSYKQIQYITYTEHPLPKTASSKIIRY